MTINYLDRFALNIFRHQLHDWCRKSVCAYGNNLCLFIRKCTRMEITVMYLEICRHQLWFDAIWVFQFTKDIHLENIFLRFRFMVFNATFNNISAISWRSVLLVGETGVSGENHRPVAIRWQTLSHNDVLSTPCH
jgi:hypothetical protein